MDVVCVGDCGIDHYRPEGTERIGGIAANFAVHARRSFGANDRIRVIAPLGDDDHATIVRRHFADTDIDCHFIEMSGRTPVQHIEVDTSGERHFVGYDEGVLADYRFDRPDLLVDAGLLVAPVFEQNVEMFASVMAAATTPTVRAVDFADFAEHPDLDCFGRFAADIDVAFFGLATDDQPMIDELRRIAHRSGVLAIVTLGADGSIALDTDGDRRCEAIPVSEVVDTTGAGDAFAAGFLAGYCADGDIEAALHAGSRLAAAAVQIAGGHDLAGI